MATREGYRYHDNVPIDSRLLPQFVLGNWNHHTFHS
jgi:hypothetical protein